MTAIQRLRKRTLGRTGLEVSPIALGGASFGYVHRSANWDPYSKQGRATAIATLNHGQDLGINYIDTAPLYGNGQSETLIGEVVARRRQECVLATKVWFELDQQGLIESVEDSMRRLQTDHLDIVQIHGRIYSASDHDRVIRKDGPLDGLRTLREAGKIGFIGITTEEPFSVIPFLAQPDIDLYQIAYNFIYQAAARHFLPQAAEANVAVVTMRTMASGVLQQQASYLAPEWQASQDLYELCLKFVLSDSRVHAGLISMRWPEEVDRNVGLIANWVPQVDLATLPRLTFEIYNAEDAK